MVITNLNISCLLSPTTCLFLLLPPPCSYLLPESSSSISRSYVPFQCGCQFMTTLAILSPRQSVFLCVSLRGGNLGWGWGHLGGWVGSRCSCDWAKAPPPHWLYLSVPRFSEFFTDYILLLATTFASFYSCLLPALLPEFRLSISQIN